MSSLILYHYDLSPHSRGLLMTIRNLELDVEIRNVDLSKKEQFNPEYLQINPAHCVPTLIDTDGTVMWESRAVAAYLVDTKSTDNRLYPKDPKIRLAVDQGLYLSATYINPRVRTISFGIVFGGETKITDEMRKGMKEAFERLNLYLEGKDFMAGETVTIADIFSVCTLSTVVNLGANYTDYKNVANWYKRCKLLPGFDENDAGGKKYAEKIKSHLNVMSRFEGLDFQCE